MLLENPGGFGGMLRSHKILRDHAAHLVTQFFYGHSGVPVYMPQRLYAEEDGWLLSELVRCHNLFAATERLQKVGNLRCERERVARIGKVALCEWIANVARTRLL